MYETIGDAVKEHMKGHMPRNKAKRAVELFDMIDSVQIAGEVNKQSAAECKIMPVTIYISSGKESNKTGVLPENVERLIEQISGLANFRIQGLITLGTCFGNPEDARSYFKATRGEFERLGKGGILNVEMHYLSMGMSNSYKIALEEGANIIRIGTKLFGECYT